MITNPLFLICLLFITISTSLVLCDDLDLLPQYKATLSPGSPKQKWGAGCYQQNEANILTFNEKLVEFEINTYNKSSLLCNDLYLIATPYNYHFKEVLIGSSHRVSFHWKSEEEYEEAKERGIFVFLIKDHIIGSIRDLYQVLKLLGGKEKTNYEFLEKHMNMTFETRSIGLVNLREEDIESGDYFAVLNAQKGEVLIMFGTGGTTDHSAVALWIDGELYVTESCGLSITHGISGVIKTPWKKWVEDYHRENSLLTLMKLSPERRAMFNETKAVEFFKKAEGSPYGFHNFIYTWIDTVSDNFPPPLSASVVEIGFALLDKMFPQYFDKFIGEALNHRLGTKDLSMFQILEECRKRNITVGELMAQKELDKWMYSDGYSMVCSVYVARIYKEAGMFGDIEIEAAEFTPRDLYQLDIWDNKKLPNCHDENDYPYCQILGTFKLPLPNAGSVKPYGHMFEKCGALPPKYQRFPSQC